MKAVKAPDILCSSYLCHPSALGTEDESYAGSHCRSFDILQSLLPLFCLPKAWAVFFTFLGYWTKLDQKKKKPHNKQQLLIWFSLHSSSTTSQHCDSMSCWNSYFLFAQDFSPLSTPWSCLYFQSKFIPSSPTLRLASISFSSTTLISRSSSHWSQVISKSFPEALALRTWLLPTLVSNQGLPRWHLS